MEFLKKKMARKLYHVRYHPFKAMNKNTGFTLIEVLIAMLVLAVGLLGLAGLQGSSLKNAQSAYNRSVATELAYDLADRMRANNTPNGLSVYISMLPVNALAQANCVAVSKLCPSNVMAQNDLYEWNLALVNTLPSGQGIVCLDSTPTPIPNDAFKAASYAEAGCDVPPGSTYAIKIWWDDDRSDAVSLPPFVVGFKL
jgi:type IV pilus assembly protein PilV